MCWVVAGHRLGAPPLLARCCVLPQNCLEPPITHEVMERLRADEDSTWFCHQCSAIAQCLDLLNQVFDAQYQNIDQVRA